MNDRLRSRRKLRGFTLTELMVSLVMGLIVALAAVGLARTATSTFNEQARSSTTEMSVRMASERLRQDLMRVSYMSTGNLPLDPKIARPVSAFTPDANVAPNIPAIARYTALEGLRGLRVINDGGLVNGLSPDTIELVGNFTTDDSYAGEINSNGTASGLCTGALQTVTLNPLADAAVYQLSGMTGTTPDIARLVTNTKNAFLPVAGSAFPARVTDINGCYHFVRVCDVVANGTDKVDVVLSGPATGRPVLYNPDPTAPIDIGTCGAFDKTQVVIAPLMRVLWKIQPAPTTTPVQSAIELAKTDLVRQVLDFAGAAAGPPEVIAEYAVDLKFGIVVEDPTQAVGARQIVFDYESDPGKQVVAITGTNDSLVPPFPKVGPQRVRSVRFRVAVRTALGDRDYDLPDASAGTAVARVCANAGCTKYARVRTVSSEVALVNQAGMFY